MELEAYVGARTLELCARKHGETDARAEQLAVERLLGRKPVINLDLALQEAAALPKAATTPAADLAAERPMDGIVEDAATAGLRAKFRQAHALSASMPEARRRIEGAVATCLYAPELGLIETELVDRYAKAFVEIACLQREMAGASGKLDVNAHAHAAARTFTENRFQAGEFARLGLVFARFGGVQEQIHKQKAARCPDPRTARAAEAATAEYNGALSGDRNGALTVTAKDGVLRGSVQWLGAHAKTADGSAEPKALAVEGVVGATSLHLFGQEGYDWVRLEGRPDGPGWAGTWQAERSMQKKKGTWKLARLAPAPPAAPETAAPAAPKPAP